MRLLAGLATLAAIGTITASAARAAPVRLGIGALRSERTLTPLDAAVVHNLLPPTAEPLVDLTIGGVLYGDRDYTPFTTAPAIESVACRMLAHDRGHTPPAQAATTMQRLIDDAYRLEIFVAGANTGRGQRLSATAPVGVYLADNATHIVLNHLALVLGYDPTRHGGNDTSLAVISIRVTATSVDHAVVPCDATFVPTALHAASTVGGRHPVSWSYSVQWVPNPTSQPQGVRDTVARAVESASATLAEDPWYFGVVALLLVDSCVLMRVLLWVAAAHEDDDDEADDGSCVAGLHHPLGVPSHPTCVSLCVASGAHIAAAAAVVVALLLAGVLPPSIRASEFITVAAIAYALSAPVAGYVGTAMLREFGCATGLEAPVLPTALLGGALVCSFATASLRTDATNTASCAASCEGLVLCAVTFCGAVLGGKARTAYVPRNAVEGTQLCRPAVTVDDAKTCTATVTLGLGLSGLCSCILLLRLLSAAMWLDDTPPVPTSTVAVVCILWMCQTVVNGGIAVCVAQLLSDGGDWWRHALCSGAAGALHVAAYFFYFVVRAGVVTTMSGAVRYMVVSGVIVVAYGLGAGAVGVAGGYACAARLRRRRRPAACAV